MSNQVYSPLPKQAEEIDEEAVELIQSMQFYDFPDAMRKVIAGERVTRLEWNNPNTCVFLNGILRIKIDGIQHDLLVSDGDMLGKDWYIV